MAVITFENATDIVLDNITVQRKYVDGVHTAYRLTANDGYVLHNPENDIVDEDMFTGEVTVIRSYYRQATIAARYAPNTWTWEAVLESTVPADQIFGGGDNNHEIV